MSCSPESKTVDTVTMSRKGNTLSNPFLPAFRISLCSFLLVFAVALCLFVSPLTIGASLVLATLLWLLFRHPLAALGAVLALMPMDYIVMEMGKFFGLPYMAIVSACTKEVPLLLIVLILGWRNGVHLSAPDWFLLAFLGVIGISTIVQGNLVGLVTDIDFFIPYAAGRVAVLTPDREGLWARRAGWIVGILSTLGLTEVFIFGSGPRTILYLATGGETWGGELPASFHGTGLAGLREASTMIGPPTFGALCMIALILWWVYGRTPWAGAMISVGLLCSVTRSAWLGTALSLLLLSIIMGQGKRFARHAGLGLALFAVSVPVLGLGDYLFATRSGEDLSEKGHRDSVLSGLQYVAEHPLGGGNEKIGPRPAEGNSNAFLVENTYLAFATEYGIMGLLCFLGFIFSAVRLAMRQKSPLGYSSLGILFGIGLVMLVFNLHDDRRLACWEWFPIGLLVGASTRTPIQKLSCPR